MKTSNSSDPPGDFLSSIYIPRGDESSKNFRGYSEELRAMLDSFDDEDWGEEKSAQIIRKKRRLSNEQVEELEKNFNIENKLEPERKAKIAEKLGLHERQVAVWFQNRRARWKAKKMEKEYGVLKSNYDELKLKKEHLERENAALNEELRMLKLKLQEKNENGNHSDKEKALFSSEQSKISPASSSSSPGLNFSPLSSSLSSSLSMNWLQFCNGGEGASQSQTQTQLGRMEKQSFFCDTTEESCSFFCQGWNNLDGSF